MTTYFVTTSKEHTCKKYGKVIKAGSRAVKKPGITQAHDTWYHEGCWR
jgi:hypothetical protein